MRCVYIYIHTYSTCTLIVRVKDIDFRLCYLSCSNFDTHTETHTHTFCNYTAPATHGSFTKITHAFCQLRI